MQEQNERTEQIFESISQNKKKRKRRIIRTVLIVILVIAILLIAAVSILRKRVTEQFASNTAEVQSYTVSTGTINTVVSGSGTLNQVDVETLTVPAGVEITEVAVKSGETVAQGDVLATVDMASVMNAMSELQAELDALDEEIADAKGDEVSSYISAGISGRVKIIYAEEGTDVGACMAEHGALAVLSLDGYMAVDIETDTAAKGDTVTVHRADGSETEGTVESVGRSTATILVTDNGPQYGEKVTVLTADGTQLGTGTLYIHNPLAITGYAGTVSGVYVSENAQVYSTSTLFYLKDTSFSANYDTLLRSREELEEELLELLTIYRDGAVLAPMDGMISSVLYSEDSSTSTSAYTTSETEETATELLTLYPNISMSTTIGIDETDILALEIGQEADIQVSSVSEDTLTGYVTEISKEASTTSGVTQYSAVVTLDKIEGMLPGMTASVDVKIEGVENALLIPVDALHQTSAIYYVYTSYNEETQQYGDMVEVTIGMQNDSYVEILSGLNEGDTVYYTEAETFSFGFGNMGGMGNMGEMPDMSGSGGFGGMPDMGGSSEGGRGNMPGGFGGMGQGG